MTQNYITVFSYIDSLCELLGTRAYMWGGWVPDIYSGKILREHDDGEHLVVNLYNYRDRIKSSFDVLGWETKLLENDDLKVVKEGMKLHFGHLETSGTTSMWFHNGKNGKIVFPTSWLNDEQVAFHRHSIHSVHPEFQYVLKLHPEFMNPAWGHRGKDLMDIKVLKEILSSKGYTEARLDQLEALMKSI